MIFSRKSWPLANNINQAIGSSAARIAIILLTLNLLATASVLCQVTDGDDSFQAYHGDIGRISAGSSSSPVAPQTIVRQLAPSPTPAPPAPLAFEPTAATRSRHSNRHHENNHQQSGSRRTASQSNRVTLAVRTRAPIAVSVAEPLGLSVIQPSNQVAALTEPTFTQPAAVFNQQSPVAASYQIPVAPLSSSGAGPALSSFRASTGHSNSVAARHSALMAQVAAERQAAAAAASTPSDSYQQYSPLESLVSPASAQVQPPPTLHSHQQQPTAAASPALTFVNQPEEPVVAPSFDHVLNNGCPHKGVFSYPNKDHCDRYYMCTNGTFTEEACPNGLAYGQMGAVYQHCAYNWNIDCGNKKTAKPVSSPGCPWQFGIFPITSNGRCSLDYYVCEWGVPETKRCSPEGLFYDDRIKGCQWADQLGCKSEAVLNFKCPPEDEENPYWPFPRYYHTKQDVVVCVNEQPRLVHCNEDQHVDPASLACIDLNKNKKKKKF